MLGREEKENADILQRVILDEQQDNSFINPPKRDYFLNQDWRENEIDGQLSVDVIERIDTIEVISTMAGVNPEDIEIFVHNDLLSIKGKRTKPTEENLNVKNHLNECFWGSFSRTIVLPVDVQGHRAQAEYKYGVLKIIIPKQESREAQIPVLVVDE